VAKGFAKEGAGQHHNAAEAQQTAIHVGAGRNGGVGGKVEEVRGPVLQFNGDASGEKYADMRIARDDGELHGRIGLRSNKIGGVPDEARKFVLANKDERVGLKRRGNEIEKVFRGDTVRGLHRRGGNGDDARGTELGGDAQSNVPAHGMAQEDGAVRNDQATCSKAARKRDGAGFGLVGCERAVGAAMAGQIGDVDDEALRSESAREIGHDDPVGGQAVKENGCATLGIFAEAGFLYDVHDEWAGAGVDQVVARGKAAGGKEGEGRAEEKEKNAGGRKNRLLMFHAEGCLRERGFRGA